MKCIEILMDEHKKVLRVMQDLETHIESKSCDLNLVEESLNFFAYFADGVHHAKEEEVLFKWMVKHHPPLEFGPIAVMLQEHDLGRALIKRSNELVEKLKINFNNNDFEDLRERLEMFINMLRQHISKEDNVLYPMAVNINHHVKNGDELMLPLFSSIQLNDADQKQIAKLLD